MGGIAVEIGGGGGESGPVCHNRLVWSLYSQARNRPTLLRFSSFGEITVISERCEGVGVVRP